MQDEDDQVVKRFDADPGAAPRDASEPLVSVIIPVRDNPDGIQETLASLARQTLPQDSFEIVIGDDGSRPELAPQVASGKSRPRVVKGPPRTSYAARNAAANLARGRVLAFCDSDCQPEPAWLEEALAALSDADVVAGEVKFTVPRQPTVWSLLTMDLFLDQKQNVLLSRGVTANLLVSRQLFNDLGGSMSRCRPAATTSSCSAPSNAAHACATRPAPSWTTRRLTRGARSCVRSGRRTIGTAFGARAEGTRWTRSER
jgi:cellulose synthase/poly-beta-1,6-N-acetylglucosamine synthase-like glycosyltransferase